MPLLTIPDLMREGAIFSKNPILSNIPSLFGSSDGKAVGTYVEHRFQEYLAEIYKFTKGNSKYGIDFPDPHLMVDIKVTSISQPQSSCPFKDAKQKIYGLGYNLMVFVYDKMDDYTSETASLIIKAIIFVQAEYTADFGITSVINEYLRMGCTKDDIIGIMQDRCLPVDEIAASLLADEIISNPPKIGYLTISNALQWRLNYSRAINFAGNPACVGLYRIC